MTFVELFRHLDILNVCLSFDLCFVCESCFVCHEEKVEYLRLSFIGKCGKNPEFLETKKWQGSRTKLHLNPPLLESKNSTSQNLTI